VADGSVQGLTHDRFESVRSVFEGNLVGGDDLGASFCAMAHGEPVVDLWGGWADPARTRAWEKDTIVNVYSTTKTMTALTALLVADRGELDFDAPVARYWPEFAANGKADVKVSHLMCHASGLAGWREPLVKEDLYDWEKVTALLAAQTPFWEPGAASGYHAMTQGYLVGEVVRRIAGRSLGTVFREEIAGPLGADFHIGLPASEDHRVAELVPPPPGTGFGEGGGDALMNSMSNPPIEVHETSTRAWRGAEIPAAGGTGNARSVALVQSLLSNGGAVGGKQILSEAGVRRALEPQIQGKDLILGMEVKFGLGFGLNGGSVPLPNDDCCFWGGYGGSLVINDLRAGTTFAFAMNRMAGTTTGDMRAFGLCMAMWGAMAD